MLTSYQEWEWAGPRVRPWSTLFKRFELKKIKFKLLNRDGQGLALGPAHSHPYTLSSLVLYYWSWTMLLATILVKCVWSNPLCLFQCIKYLTSTVWLQPYSNWKETCKSNQEVFYFSNSVIFRIISSQSINILGSCACNCLFYLATILSFD